MLTEVAIGQPLTGEGETPAAAPEQRRTALRQAVQAQRAASEGQAMPERRLSAQDHAELRQQLIRISAERRGAAAGR